ncbi:MAG: hypothetical protein ACUVQY_09190 [Thermoproteota archaeon]
MSSKVDGILAILSVIISLLGLSIVIFMAFNPPLIHEDVLWRKPLIGTIFNLICLLGILATVFPKKCSRALYRKEKPSNITHRKIKGHHPDCEAFSTHAIKIGERTLCAACTGLLIGGIITLIGSTLYFSGLWIIEGVFLQLILIGALGVAQIFLKPELKASFRLLANILFPIGALLILIGIDGLFGSTCLDMFLNALIIFWIMTRITMSNWGHMKICSECKFPCELSRKVVE